MSEEGTYSDPRCATCGPPSRGPRPYHRGRFAPNPPGWQEVDGVQLPPITWAERLASAEAKYDVAMNKLADAVNARIPAPDVLRNGRAE